MRRKFLAARVSFQRLNRVLWDSSPIGQYRWLRFCSTGATGAQQTNACIQNPCQYWVVTVAMQPNQAKDRCAKGSTRKPSGLEGQNCEPPIASVLKNGQQDLVQTIDRGLNQQACLRATRARPQPAARQDRQGVRKISHGGKQGAINNKMLIAAKRNIPSKVFQTEINSREYFR